MLCVAVSGSEVLLVSVELDGDEEVPVDLASTVDEDSTCVEVFCSGFKALARAVFCEVVSPAVVLLEVLEVRCVLVADGVVLGEDVCTLKLKILA